ncbi:type II toxin-antitoxin system Phd/YefM family antitoxin [Pseudaminobacter sp. 19-2017]|uniref:Antitoxin n=1 Tax=Pseudaminobacter soli (ex Zhang et al. 2022) TaxID=2831468 RepID=A0A942DWB2_9HYPH|nr:type II toxin-antitoxin system Phd/YefM family antitoxin [Pseudaminobacter soli]MBS3648434.1 type II toxin-antitoxin system Phd/YefM family antitoxin [Pseudaminobacter soli]
MREVDLREAKARLSQLIEEVAAGETVVVARDGHKTAVMIGWAEYEKLTNIPSLGWLLTHSPLLEDDFASRRSARSLDRGS